MSEINKTYRIRANVGGENTENFIALDTSLVQDYDTLDILSIKIKSADTYRLHNSNYGVIVGRVLANNGFGVPNAKISVFIKTESEEGELVKQIYPFSASYDKDIEGVRYNLLPDEKVNDCHQIVGTFPNKRYMLDNDVILEIFDKYYKYTTRTNNSGDYLIMGVPVGNHTLHMDLDISDCGILSQRPRDFVYKGYTMEQFENPSLFKGGTNYPELSQVFTQDRVINVIPFWGNESLGESIGITRADIDVAFKFEPTCVFIGSVVSDNVSNGITEKCQVTENMGNMEELTTGAGTIEMIRKTPTGSIESFAIRGTQLINGDGVWCYQIPMNLDYMMTDEYGNMVPTNDPKKGIPTRASVRFRISMQDNEENLDFFYRCKVLVPHNPQYIGDKLEKPDYVFGTNTKDESFRDLFWDNVYTVKSYIPRFQKRNTMIWKEKNFSGIKNCNFHGSNNPFPYNNLRIKLPLMFTIMCALIKCLIALVSIWNAVIYQVGKMLYGLRGLGKVKELLNRIRLDVLNEGLCPDLENWYFAPIAHKKNLVIKKDYNILANTMDGLKEDNGYNDSQSIDADNKDSNDETMCITTKTDYLISCIEMNLAMEYRVINFDFYNDWINGTIYVPRFMIYNWPKLKPKDKNGNLKPIKYKGCFDDKKISSRQRKYVQLCAIGYDEKSIGEYTLFTAGKRNKHKNINKMHASQGSKKFKLGHKDGGICHQERTSKGQFVYYAKPYDTEDGKKIIMYATDLVLLGSLRNCDTNGLPQAFKYLTGTSYIMPSNLAMTNMETNGTLYVNAGGAFCSGQAKQNMSSNLNSDEGVKPLDPNKGMIAELTAYKKSNNPNINTTYDSEFTDIIPLTESAGIAWNYTGPGQGEIDKDKMYYPGGHFLGLTCMNSQTNLKSCINLARICEVGATMSQRKEDIIDVDADGDFEYIYTAPTGFISGNDINGEDFRAMFATMNQKRLQATKIDNETGYYHYDFDFVKPLNFDGAFENYVSGQYNGKIEINVPSSGDLASFGILLGLGYNFDANESLRTQTKTTEHPSIDYYRFRFGLSYDDILTTNKNKIKHQSKFLIDNGEENGKYFLPQYENSYYFYFGLKAGATAIDEFNKQFYSPCDTTIIGNKAPTINVQINDIKLSAQTGDVEIILDNVETPLLSVEYMYKKEATGTEQEKWEAFDITSAWSQYYSINLNDIPFGYYKAYVVDFNGNELVKDFAIGVDIITLSTKKRNFNVANDMDYKDISNTIRKNNYLFTGGYVEISNVNIGETYVTDISSALTFIIANNPKDEWSVSGQGETVSAICSTNATTSSILCVKSAFTNYHLYVCYNVLDESGHTIQLPLERALYLETFQVKDGRNLQLAMGQKNKPYSIVSISGDSKTIMEGHEEIDDVDLNFGNNGKVKWWENTDINDDSNGKISNWLKRVNITKSSDYTETFSNNIFVLNGEKVIWGVPQNSNEVYEGDESGKTIFNTFDDPYVYAGYSLDDDASYYGTNEHYSAIAINGADYLVSGNFFAYESGNTIYSANTLTKGLFPVPGTGYVFKPLPEGDLEYLTYNRTIEQRGRNGVYYAAFEYPVIEKPFDVNSNFYIWGNYDVSKPINDDSIANVEYKELGGRTELTVSNGIKYNGSYGLLDSKGKIVSGVNISNMTVSEFQSAITSGETFSVIGMNTLDYDEDGNVVGYECSYGTKNGYKYSTGSDDITNIICEISEGYPSGFDNLITKYSTNVEYNEAFPLVARYEYYKGRGIEVNTYYDDPVKTRPQKGTGSICLLSGNTENNFLIKVPGNEGYIYYNSGKNNRPIYNILCQYTKGVMENGVYNHTSPEGELCFMKIEYYNDSEFHATYSYHDNSGKVVTPEIKYKNAGTRRYNIDLLCELISEKTEKFITPVTNWRINCNIDDWNNAISEASYDYIKWLSNKNNQALEEEEVSETFFYVETYNNVHKIFPVLLKDNVVNDGVILDTYYVSSLNTGTGVSGLTVTVSYKIYEFSGDTEDMTLYQANDSGTALTRCQYMYNGLSAPISGLSSEKIETSWFAITSDSGTVEYKSFNDNNYYEVTYVLNITIKGATTDFEKENYFKDSLYFYITNRNMGVRLDIERLIKGDYKPLLCEYTPTPTYNWLEKKKYKYCSEIKSNAFPEICNVILEDKLPGLSKDEIQFIDVTENIALDMYAACQIMLDKPILSTDSLTYTILDSSSGIGLAVANIGQKTIPVIKEGNHYEEYLFKGLRINFTDIFNDKEQCQIIMFTNKTNTLTYIPKFDDDDLKPEIIDSGVTLESGATKPIDETATPTDTGEILGSTSITDITGVTQVTGITGSTQVTGNTNNNHVVSNKNPLNGKIRYVVLYRGISKPLFMDELGKTVILPWGYTEDIVIEGRLLREGVFDNLSYVLIYDDWHYNYKVEHDGLDFKLIISPQSGKTMYYNTYWNGSKYKVYKNSGISTQSGTQKQNLKINYYDNFEFSGINFQCLPYLVFNFENSLSQETFYFDGETPTLTPMVNIFMENSGITTFRYNETNVFIPYFNPSSEYTTLKFDVRYWDETKDDDSDGYPDTDEDRQLSSGLYYLIDMHDRRIYVVDGRTVLDVKIKSNINSTFGYNNKTIECSTVIEDPIWGPQTIKTNLTATDDTPVKLQRMGISSRREIKCKTVKIVKNGGELNAVVSGGGFTITQTVPGLNNQPTIEKIYEWYSDYIDLLGSTLDYSNFGNGHIYINLRTPIYKDANGNVHNPDTFLYIVKSEDYTRLKEWIEKDEVNKNYYIPPEYVLHVVDDDDYTGNLFIHNLYTFNQEITFVYLIINY